MKKIVLLTLFLLTLTGCSIDDDQPNYSYEVLPVDSYTLPAIFHIGRNL